MKRNKFSLSHYRLMSCSMGELVPCGLVEVLPGDSIQQATSILARMSPMVAPVMHPCHIRIHHWFVPTRLIWEDWEDFITGGPDGMDDSVPPYFTVSSGGAPNVGTLADYLGLPTGNAYPAAFNWSALPARAYALIWNEWYRDQDLQAELPLSVAAGHDVITNTLLQSVAWEKDYFTSARPWAQKGPSVVLPLGSVAPVNIKDSANSVQHIKRSSASADQTANVEETGVDDSRLTFTADLSSATAVDINAVREAFALQRYAEARARYGSRYTEYLRYLGVRSSDARLQRPEYLGGGKQTLQISEVLQTALNTDGDPTDGGVGQLAGHGIGALRSNRYRRFFEEHGYILSLVSVKPKTIYIDGLPRIFSRTTKEHYYQKELEHIGQQEVLNKEIYAIGASPEGVFGYQDRYDEYRRMESTVNGEFRNTLDFWHLARKFGSAPALNGAFVKSDPTTRVFADEADDTMWLMISHSIQARRMLAKTGSSFIY